MKRYILQYKHPNPTIEEVWMDHYATLPRHPDMIDNPDGPPGLKTALNELRKEAPHLEWRVVSREIVETVLDW